MGMTVKNATKELRAAVQNAANLLYALEARDERAQKRIAEQRDEIERLTAERNETAMLLSLHMKRAEQAEAERDEARRLAEENQRLREALEPFADVAEHDIGTDEADSDAFRPMFGVNRAPYLTVGDLRRARSALDVGTDGSTDGLTAEEADCEQ